MVFLVVGPKVHVRLFRQVIASNEFIKIKAGLGLQVRDDNCKTSFNRHCIVGKAAGFHGVTVLTVPLTA
jgi:hypothetical protein